MPAIQQVPVMSIITHSPLMTLPSSCICHHITYTPAYTESTGSRQALEIPEVPVFAISLYITTYSPFHSFFLNLAHVVKNHTYKKSISKNYDIYLQWRLSFLKSQIWLELGLLVSDVRCCPFGVCRLTRSSPHSSSLIGLSGTCLAGWTLMGL